MRKIDQYNYDNKRVLLRVDLNVPSSDGIVLDDTRIDKIIPTIKYLLEANAKIILASHFGRPKGIVDPKFSLNFLVDKLSDKLGQKIEFCSDISVANTTNLRAKEILLLENLRFYPGETKNDLEFAKQLANLADFYINDAFSCSHRAHASIVKITELLPSAAGLLLIDEVESLSKYLMQPEKPMMAIIGGSKISTKLDLLMNLVNKVDYLVVGGAMANSFLKAQGYEIGASFYEPDLITTAKSILEQAKMIILPQDVVVAEEISNNALSKIVKVNQVEKNQLILDIGPQTVMHVNNLLRKCKTLVFNGPLGVFEYDQFSLGTIGIAQEIVTLTNEGNLISVAGGGDIVAALSKAELVNQFTYISTAGGAFLEWLEGKELPGLKALE